MLFLNSNQVYQNNLFKINDIRLKNFLFHNCLPLFKMFNKENLFFYKIL